MVEYFHLKSESKLPDFSHYSPFRAVLILEKEVESDWQSAVSEWIVDMGCLYVMAWGVGCASWDDSVDYANLEKSDFENTLDEKFVVTTYHERESLNDVFWFSKNCASHPYVKLDNTIIIHIADRCRPEDILGEYIRTPQANDSINDAK